MAFVVALLIFAMVVAAVGGLFVLLGRLGAGPRRDSPADRDAALPAGKGGTAPAKRLSLASHGDCHRFDIVGEASYQGRLRRVDQGRRREGADVEFTALVIAEPTNPFDPNAIRVDAEGFGTVGYFSRDDALQYAPLRELLLKEGAAGTCDATLIGGWEDDNGRPVYLGVQILIPDPDAFGAAPQFLAYRSAPAPAPYRAPDGWGTLPRRGVVGPSFKPVNIVDEWPFRDELRRIDGGRVAQGETVTFTAVLIPDETGVIAEPLRLLVWCDGGSLVGRLSTSVMARYQALVTDLRDARAVGVCEGWIFAEKSGSLGVKLMLPPPAKAALASVEPPPFDESFDGGS